jgi:hypothetical protein
MAAAFLAAQSAGWQAAVSVSNGDRAVHLG